ncbi:MAG: HD domain-containing protein [Lachnospiraceae bacterium]|nr:HD domain-containing protein [Lachnospiraceae bacterium]
MKIKEVKYIKSGEILASPIYTDEKTILIPAGTELKKEYIDLLLPLGIEIVEIEDKYESIEKSSLIIPEEVKSEFKEKIQNILGKHIYSGKGSLCKIKDIAIEIIDFVNNIDLNCIYDIPYRQTDLYEHTISVTIFSLLVARKINLSQERMEDIAIGCLLHDLGLRYITIPYVNKKIDELPPEDIFEYKKHTILAYTVLDEEEWLSQVSKNMVLSHHEKMNGSGFPLKQREQDIECRIIQLCDSFDCLISGMECGRYSVEKVMNYFLTVAGEKYDKDLMKDLFSMIGKYPVGTEVELSDHTYGVVTCQTNCIDCPIINLLDEMSGNIVENKVYDLNENKEIQIIRVI